jgi:hypothetical protein
MSDYEWIEAVFIAAVVLGLGGWQLWSVNREIARDRAKKAEEEALKDPSPRA